MSTFLSWLVWCYLYTRIIAKSNFVEYFSSFSQSLVIVYLLCSLSSTLSSFVPDASVQLPLPVHTSPALARLVENRTFSKFTKLQPTAYNVQLYIQLAGLKVTVLTL